MRKLHVWLALPTLCLAAACQQADDTAGEAPPATSEAEPLDGDDALIASALSAGPADVTDKATVITGDGTVLREGSNGWTCVAETPGMGPMCNDKTWMAALGAMQSGGAFPTGSFGVSYMLAGEGGAPGVSNIDPSATEPTDDNQWIKDGPHMMIILPDPALYADMTTDIEQPVYVMWKDTPFAHLMVRIAEPETE